MVARAALIHGQKALAAFQLDEAILLLDMAAAAGPHDLASLILLHEQQGIAYSYLGEEEQAIDAFDMLLSLDPGHLLSYTLSPKATFLYERARKARVGTEAAAINLSWPQGLVVDRDVPITVEILADPRRMLKSAVLLIRDKGDKAYKRVSIELPTEGSYSELRLPAIHGDYASTLQVYAMAYDDAGSQVLRWSNSNHPREIPLGYVAPVPWHKKWWVWASIGGVVAASTGATVYLLSLEDPDIVGGELTVP